MDKGWKGILVAMGAVTWAFVVYVNYYINHKPFTPSVAVGLLDSLGNVAVFLLMAAAALAVGGWATRDLKYPDSLSEIVFSLGLGWGILSLATFVLGLAGLLHRGLFWLLYLGVVALFHRPLWRSLGRLRGGSSHGRIQGFDRLLLGYSATVLGLSFIMALTPPLEWDALLYHLTAPRHYMEAGRIYVLTGNFCANFPAFTEMLFLSGMLLKGDVVAHLIHWGYALLVALALYAFGREHFGHRTGLLSQAIFLSIPTVLTIAAWAYVDLALSLYGFAAYWALTRWLDDRRAGGWLCLAGVLAGMAFSIKYTGASIVLVLVTVILYRGWSDRVAWSKTIRASILVGVVAAFLASPWYLKNAVALGNPVYPYLFGGRGWNELRELWFSSYGRPMAWWEVALVPWDMTIRGGEGKVAYESTLSPLFLLLLPLLAVVHRKGRRWSELGVFSLIVYGIWIWGGRAAHSNYLLLTRILFPCFVPLSLLAAHALQGCARWTWPQFSLRRFLMMVLAATLALTALGQSLSVIIQRPLEIITSMESRERFATTRMGDGHYSAMKYIDQRLDPGSHTLFLWEPRGYYCVTSCQPDMVLDAWPQLAAKYGTSAAALLRGVEGEGFTHILINERVLEAIVDQGSSPLTGGELTAFQEFRGGLSPPLYQEDGFYSLYALGEDSEHGGVGRDHGGDSND
jgi:hypothetical protein